MTTLRRLRRGLVVLVLFVATGCQGPGPGDEPIENFDGASSSNEEDIFYGTAAEYTAEMSACLQGAGWVVTLMDDDSTAFEVEVLTEQDDAYREDREKCIEQIGAFRRESFSDDYIKQLYDHMSAQRQCLIDLGYDIPAPPTYEVFYEMTDWDPMAEVPDEDFHSALEECPGLHQKAQ